MTTYIPGGFIETDGFWQNAATGEKLPYWKATRTDTGEAETFFSRQMAEFFVWVYHERVEAEQFRKGHLGRG